MISEGSRDTGLEGRRDFAKKDMFLDQHYCPKI